MNDRDELAALVERIVNEILGRWRLMPIEEEPYRLRTPQEMADMVLKQMAGESAQPDPSTG